MCAVGSASREPDTTSAIVPSVTGNPGGLVVTATQNHEAPPISPDITVRPIHRAPKRLPYPLSIYQSSVGKKWVMAITGIMMMGFVLFHMIGNAKMYLGPVEYNAYAEGLRTFGEPLLPRRWFLWILEIGLMGAFVLHLHSAYSLTMLNRRSRGVKTKRDYIAANFASLTMRYSGIILLAFIGFHLLTLTFGKGGPAMPDYVDGDVYGNVVNTLSVWWVAVIYIISNLALGVHLFHGAWSIFQSLGVNNPRFNGLRRGFAIGFAAIVCGVNISFPIAVLTGVVGN